MVPLTNVTKVMQVTHFHSLAIASYLCIGGMAWLFTVVPHRM